MVWGDSPFVDDTFILVHAYQEFGPLTPTLSPKTFALTDLSNRCLVITNVSGERGQEENGLAKPMADTRVTTLSPVKKRIALGYLVGGSKKQLDNVPWEQLTHIAHAFLIADPEGNLLPSEDISVT